MNWHYLQHSKKWFWKAYTVVTIPVQRINVHVFVHGQKEEPLDYFMSMMQTYSQESNCYNILLHAEHLGFWNG